MLGAIFLCLILYMIGLYDACYQRIPMIPVWLASGVGVIFQTCIEHRSLYSVVTTAGGVALFFLLQYVVSKGRWIGEGDIWLGMLIGVWFLWEQALLAVWLAYVGGAVVSLALLASGRFHKKSTLPLGTFLIVGALTSFFAGDAILAWYLGQVY
jgi:prepilin signal peptidase PulO-like enzyme (type II secretory pathway)